MPQIMVPLTIDLVDEGHFVSQANADLQELQARLRHFRDVYGERANGTKAKLTMEIVLACEKTDATFFSIKSTTKTTLPQRPPCVTLAAAGETQTDELCLLVRASGSDSSPPQQQKLCTDDGRVIDTETGQIMEAATEDDDED